MSVIICFPDGSDWFKANWVFRQLAEDVSKAHSEDLQLIQTMEESQAIGALFLDRMESPIYARVTQALKEVIEGTLEGKVEGWRKHDPKGHAM